jgi:uncharacterized protein
MLIIDSHCHAGKGDGFTGPWDTDAPLDKFVRRSQQAGISKTVIFAAFHSDYSKANEQVADIVNRYPDLFFGYAFVNADRDKGKIFRMIETGVNDYGFIGIKVHRYDATISREICEVARHFSLPVLYDVRGEVASVELFAREYPTVNFIVPHLGSYADDWKAQLAFIDHLVRHPNVYTDSSCVKRFDMLEMAYKRAGAQKILFGSDGPWHHPGIELMRIKALQPPEKDAALMLSGNFLKLTANVRRKQQAASHKLQVS